MILATEDAKLFYRLTRLLHVYVNNELKILKGMNSTGDYGRFSMDEKLKVRNALYDNIDLIDRYTAENPDRLPMDDLRLIEDWKNFRKGQFFIERFLRKSAILIHCVEPMIAYSVLGLYDSLRDMVGMHPTPVLVDTVLLPFKKAIVCDGMLQAYNITLGPGMKSNLRELYLKEKQNGRIITTLDINDEKGSRKPPARMPSKDWLPEVEEIVEKTAKLRSALPVEKALFELLKTATVLTRSYLSTPGDSQMVYTGIRRVQSSLKRLATVMGRIDNDRD